MLGTYISDKCYHCIFNFFGIATICAFWLSIALSYLMLPEYFIRSNPSRKPTYVAGITMSPATENQINFMLTPYLTCVIILNYLTKIHNKLTLLFSSRILDKCFSLLFTCYIISLLKHIAAQELNG